MTIYDFFLERGLRNINAVRGGVVSAEVVSTWPSSTDVTSLVAKSSGSFIYASTLLKFIGDKRAILPHQQLEIVLNTENGPELTDLDQLYRQVLFGGSTPGDLRLVLGAILLLRTPLNLRALGCLLGLEWRWQKPYGWQRW